MGPCITLDDQNRPASADMVEYLAMPAGWVLARVHVICERRDTGVRGRSDRIGGAQFDEFVDRAFAAMGANDKHAGLMEVGHGALAFFVDDVARGEAVESERRVERMWRVVGDRVREAPAGCRRGLEAAVAPAGV